MNQRAEQEGFGKAAITFRIKDWGISRQRYWGTPIPVIHCPKCGMVPVPEKRSAGGSSARREDDGKGTVAAAGRGIVHEREVSQVRRSRRAARATPWTRSSIPPGISIATAIRRIPPRPFDSKKIAYWFPIDQYIGGVEHAILHLIYSRFFTKVMRDLGLITN